MARAVKARVCTKLRGLEHDVAHTDGLCPSPRFLCNLVQKARRGSKNTASKNDLLGIQQTDQIGARHAPIQDGFRQHFRRHRVPLLVCRENVASRGLVRTRLP